MSNARRREGLAPTIGSRPLVTSPDSSLIFPGAGKRASCSANDWGVVLAGYDTNVLVNVSSPTITSTSSTKV